MLRSCVDMALACTGRGCSVTSLRSFWCFRVRIINWVGLEFVVEREGGRMRNHSHARMTFAWTASVTVRMTLRLSHLFCLWDREPCATYYVGPLFFVSVRMLLTCLTSFLS